MLNEVEKMTDKPTKRLVCVERFHTYPIERTEELHDITDKGDIIGKTYIRRIPNKPKFKTYTVISLSEYTGYELIIAGWHGYYVYQRTFDCEKEKVNEIYEKLKLINYREILMNSTVNNKVDYEELLKVIDEYITKELKQSS